MPWCLTGGVSSRGLSRRMERARMKPSLLAWAVVGVLCCGLAFAAEPRTFRLGKMEIAYDPGRWSSERGRESSVTMLPIGALAQSLTPVVITRASESRGLDDCSVLARQVLRQDLYVEPTTSPMGVAERPAIRFTAHTRCRNSTPSGVAICTYHAGSGYVLSMTIASCRTGGGGLGGPDTLDEFTQGIRFVP